MDALIAIPAFMISGLLAAPFCFPKGQSAARRRLLVLLTLILPPACTYAWGQAFAIAPRCTFRPWWMSGALLVFTAASLLLPCALLPAMSGGRRFTLAIGLFALGLTLGLAFLATMQISGCWI